MDNQISENKRDATQKKNKTVSSDIIIKTGITKMFTLEYIAFPLSILSIVMTFIFNVSYILVAPKWLLFFSYFSAFGLAISGLILSLIVACSKNKVAFIPSLVVSILAVFAAII